jgi:CRP/FNR family nitrogen fixation transcriptional regulator
VILGKPPALRSYAANAEIFAQEESASGLYRVVSGAVCSYRLLSDGRRQILAFHLPGDTFGLEADKIHFVSAEAIVPSGVVKLRPGSPEDLWEVAKRCLMQAQDHVILLGRMNALERVIAFLLEMSARQGGSSVVNLPMTRLDIADYLGLTLETVSRMFAELNDLGIIRLLSARRVELVDAEALGGTPFPCIDGKARDRHPKRRTARTAPREAVSLR